MTKYTTKLRNKRVLVVGGTSGIGFCVAEAALEQGAIVIVSSSRQAKVDSTIDKLRQINPEGVVSGHPCDLSDPQTTFQNLKILLEFATRDGKLDHIVNTAGDTLQTPSLAEVTPEKFFAGQQVRLIGSMLLARHATSYMNISNASSITFTGGVNTHKPAPGWAVVAATGAGIEGMVRGLAVDMKPVRVNAVAPGAVLTELWDGVFTSAEARKNVVEAYRSKHLTGEIGSPEDVAEAYLYLMKDKFVDGQIILTEGGLLLM